MLGSRSKIKIKLEIVTSNLRFSQDVSPAQDAFTQLFIGHFSRIPASNSFLSCPKQNLLFFSPETSSFIPSPSKHLLNI